MRRLADKILVRRQKMPKPAPPNVDVDSNGVAIWYEETGDPTNPVSAWVLKEHQYDAFKLLRQAGKQNIIIGCTCCTY